MNNEIVILFFSKNRPLQLDAALSSYAKHSLLTLEESNNPPKKVVLYKKTTDRYHKAYQKVMKQHPTVQFVEETNFKQDIWKILSSSAFVLFVVDDAIFVRDFVLSDMSEMLTLYPEAIGFSLRLGRNIDYCYPIDKPQSLPDFRTFVHNDIYLKFDWRTADGDFGYPMDVSSSLYETSLIRDVIKYMDISNPNDLEWQLHQWARWEGARISNDLLICRQSVAFCAPMNIVQTVNNNRRSNNSSYTPYELLIQFENGFRIDVDKFNNFVPKGCHEEVEFDFVYHSGV